MQFSYLYNEKDLLQGPNLECHGKGNVSQKKNMERGMPHGKVKTFYIKEIIKSSTEYKKGKPHGDHKTYNEKGEVSSNILYQEGKEILIKDEYMIQKNSFPTRIHIKEFILFVVYSTELDLNFNPITDEQ